MTTNGIKHALNSVEVKKGAGCAESHDAHAVLEVQAGADADAVDKALKIKLLSIENTNCPASHLYYGGAWREEESSCYPVDDMVAFEKVNSARFILNSSRRRQYDQDLLVDPHRLSQLRTTQRHMYSMRADSGFPERRLPELRQTLLGATADAETDGIRDEMRYLVLQQTLHMTHQQCVDEANRLRNHAIDKKHIAAAAANSEAIEIIQAEIDSMELRRQLRMTSVGSLEVRRIELNELLVAQHAVSGDRWFYEPGASAKPEGVRYPERAIADIDCVFLAKRRTELRADIHRLESHLQSCDDTSLEGRARVAHMQCALRELDNAEVNRSRDELRLILMVLAEQEDLRNLEWGTALADTRSRKKLKVALKVCEGFCKTAKPLDEYRRDSNGDIPPRCASCVFPSCEACGRKPTKAVREQAKDAHTGAWCSSWEDE